jgi:hypothetical protein
MKTANPENKLKLIRISKIGKVNNLKLNYQQIKLDRNIPTESNTQNKLKPEHIKFPSVSNVKNILYSSNNSISNVSTEVGKTIGRIKEKSIEIAKRLKSQESTSFDITHQSKFKLDIVKQENIKDYKLVKPILKLRKIERCIF